MLGIDNITIIKQSNAIVIYQNSCYQQQLREQNTFTSLFGQFATAELKRSLASQAAR